MMLERKRCQNPPVLGGKGEEKASPTSLCPEGRSGGAGGHFGGSELHEGLGTEQKQCRSRCVPLRGTKTCQGLGVLTKGDRSWQWPCPPAFGMVLLVFFSQLSPQVTVREGPSPPCPEGRKSPEGRPC